ncbi:MAG TPA: alpha/beta fold hydrolase [Anaerolineae bacterium]|nr:alpha/beta fold hydrolase [Anaerolineae bacterium]HIP70286.1 alpha/beta fold hydrolase [Anaerolineae bacterium]
MPFTPDYPVNPERQAYTEYAQTGNGRTGILMLHGYMGSPLSSHNMAKFLAGRGITVHCPLLPGHGQYPDKLKGVKREQWIAEAAEGYDCISQQCDEVFLMGHSMGAVLGADLCRKHPQIKGLIMLTPVYDTPDDRLNLFRWLYPVVPWFYPTWIPSKRMRKLVRERVLDYDPTMDPDDPAVKKQLPRLTRIPTGSLAEMLKMIDYGRTIWPDFHHPVIIFHGKSDPAVKPGSIEKLYEILPNDDKQLFSFPDSGHEVMRTLDPAHEEVWQRTYQFVRERSEIGLPDGDTAVPHPDVCSDSS